MAGLLRLSPLPFWVRGEVSTQTIGPPPSALNKTSTRTLPEDVGGGPACQRRTPGAGPSTAGPARRLDLAASPEKDQFIACSLVESGICVLTDKIPANVAAREALGEPLVPSHINDQEHDPATTTTDGMEIDTDPRGGSVTTGGRHAEEHAAAAATQDTTRDTAAGGHLGHPGQDAAVPGSVPDLSGDASLPLEEGSPGSVLERVPAAPEDSSPPGGGVAPGNDGMQSTTITDCEGATHAAREALARSSGQQLGKPLPPPPPPPSPPLATPPPPAGLRYDEQGALALDSRLIPRESQRGGESSHAFYSILGGREKDGKVFYGIAGNWADASELTSGTE